MLLAAAAAAIDGRTADVDARMRKSGTLIEFLPCAASWLSIKKYVYI